MKKVLLVAYHFPPSNAVGALRPAKFAQYLPEFGWEPVVLRAPAEGEGGGWQFAELAGVPTETVAAWPGLRDAVLALKSAARGNGSQRSAAGSGGAAVADRNERRAEAAWRTEYMADAVRRSYWKDLVYSLMWLPDDRQGWIPPAVVRVLAAIRRERPDALLVTSPPHSAQVVGLFASRISGVPLVVDFRDPWIGNPATPEFIRSGPTPAVHELLEDQVMHVAGAVVTATDSHADSLRVRRPGVAPRLRVIPNGYDPSAFRGQSMDPVDPERFTITYAGSFYHTRTPRPLLEALAVLRDRDGIDPAVFRVNLVGNCEFAGTESVPELAAALGCESSLELPGRLPYRDAIGHLVRSDLLLLLATGQPEQVPAKAYEYVAAGRPILALVEPGATADLLVSSADADVLFDADPHRIADVLARRLAAWRERPSRSGRTWQPDERAIRFDRRRLTGELARALDLAGAA